MGRSHAQGGRSRRDRPHRCRCTQSEPTARPARPGGHTVSPDDEAADQDVEAPEEAAEAVDEVRPAAPGVLPADLPALPAALEAVLLVTDEPVPAMTLAQVVERPTGEVEAVLSELARDYAESGRGFELRQVAGGWR